MRFVVLLVLAVAACACGLKSPGRRLPDGGYIGTSEGCNRSYQDGNLVIESTAAPFSTINAVRFDADGNLYVLNRTSSDSYISVFGPSPNNDYSRAIGRGLLRDGIDFTLAPDGTYWVLEDRSGATIDPAVVHLSAEGVQLSKFNVETDEVGGLALGSDGMLYVASYRIGRYDADGMPHGVFGSKDPAPPRYQGLQFDSTGFLWATEMFERTVERFDVRSGDRSAKFGGHGSEVGKFDGNTDVHGGPSDIAIDAKGDLYVNDPLGSRIMKLNRQGSPLGEFKFGGADNVEPIAVDPRTGNVYVGRDNGVDIICPL